MHPKYVVPFLLDQDANIIKLPGAIATAWAAPVEVTIKKKQKKKKQQQLLFKNPLKAFNITFTLYFVQD